MVVLIAMMTGFIPIKNMLIIQIMEITVEVTGVQIIIMNAIAIFTILQRVM